MSIPTTEDDSHYYATSVKGNGAKPLRWHGYVHAVCRETAETIIRRASEENTLSLFGIDTIDVQGSMSANGVRHALGQASKPNAVLFMDDKDRIRRLTRAEVATL